MLGSNIGVGARVARSVVVFQLRAATIPDALGERGALSGMSLGVGFKDHNRAAHGNVEREGWSSRSLFPPGIT